MNPSTRGCIRWATLGRVKYMLMLLSVYSLIDSDWMLTSWNFSSSESLSIPSCHRCPVVEPRVIVMNSTAHLFDQIALAHALEETTRGPSCPSCITTVMTFVDYKYLDTLSLWLHYYKQLDNSHRVLCLFVLSDTAFLALKRVMSSIPEASRALFGRVVVVRASLPKGFQRNSGLWAYRVRILSRFLNSLPSQNVLFTDIDAFWIRDPAIFFSSTTSTPLPGGNDPSEMADIIASQGEFPKQCSLLYQAQTKKQLHGIGRDGGTVVFGFIFFQNSLATRNVAAKLAQLTFKDSSFDDQSALNCQLYNSYNLSSSHRLHDGSFVLKYSFPSKHIIPPTKNAAAADSDDRNSFLTVRILSGSQVVRRCDKAETINSTVVHCLSNKTQQAKAESAQVFGLVPTDVTMYDWYQRKTKNSKV